MVSIADDAGVPSAHPALGEYLRRMLLDAQTRTPSPLPNIIARAVDAALRDSDPRAARLMALALSPLAGASNGEAAERVMTHLEKLFCDPDADVFQI